MASDIVCSSLMSSGEAGSTDNCHYCCLRASLARLAASVHAILPPHVTWTLFYGLVGVATDARAQTHARPYAPVHVCLTLPNDPSYYMKRLSTEILATPYTDPSNQQTDTSHWSWSLDVVVECLKPGQPSDGVPPAGVVLSVTPSYTPTAEGSATPNDRVHVLDTACLSYWPVYRGRSLLQP